MNLLVYSAVLSTSLPQYMSRISQRSSLSHSYRGDNDRNIPQTPRDTHRDSFMTTTTTTSATTDTTTTTTTSASSSTFTGSSYTATNSSGDSSSQRTYDRRSSSTYSSVVQSEIVELEQMIFKFKEQLDAHKRRADAEERRANDAERRLQEYAEHLTKVNKARLVAQQEANKANEELRLVPVFSYLIGILNHIHQVVQTAVRVCPT